MTSIFPMLATPLLHGGWLTFPSGSRHHVGVTPRRGSPRAFLPLGVSGPTTLPHITLLPRPWLKGGLRRPSSRRCIASSILSVGIEVVERGLTNHRSATNCDRRCTVGVYAAQLRGIFPSAASCEFGPLSQRQSAAACSSRLCHKQLWAGISADMNFPKSSGNSSQDSSRTACDDCSHAGAHPVFQHHFRLLGAARCMPMFTFSA